jgi:hypothetical protein
VDGTTMGSASYAGELVFYHFLKRNTGKPTYISGFNLAPLMHAAKLSPKPSHVAFMGCQGGYHWGLYPLGALNFPDMQITDPAAYPPAERLEAADFTAAQILEASDYLIHNASCKPQMPAGWQQNFTRLTRRGTDQLYVRTRLLN